MRLLSGAPRHSSRSVHWPGNGRAATGACQTAITWWLMACTVGLIGIVGAIVGAVAIEFHIDALTVITTPFVHATHLGGATIRGC